MYQCYIPHDYPYDFTTTRPASVVVHTYSTKQPSELLGAVVPLSSLAFVHLTFLLPPPPPPPPFLPPQELKRKEVKRLALLVDRARYEKGAQPRQYTKR